MSSLTATPSRRAQAARENAAKSTGPRTPAGRRRSSQNATTHALFCQDLLHESESPDLFHALRHAFLEDLNPQTALELALADRAVAAQWRLRRCLTAEARLLDLADADLAADLDDHNAHAQRLRAELADHDADEREDPGAEQLADHPALDPVEPFDCPLSPGLHLARALHASATSPDPGRRNRTTPFERLVATEQRLQGMLHRALKELRAAQAARRARAKDPDADAEPPCPFLPAAATPARRDRDRRVQPDATGCNHLGKLQNEAKCHPDTPPAEAHHSSVPAQNEPTPSSSPSVSPCLCGTLLPPPAQNEPTTHNEPSPMYTPSQPTTDQGQRTTNKPTPHNTPHPTAAPSTPTPIRPMTP